MTSLRQTRPEISHSLPNIHILPNDIATKTPSPLTNDRSLTLEAKKPSRVRDVNDSIKVKSAIAGQLWYADLKAQG